jgi:Protein of unknown function (DUF3179)
MKLFFFIAGFALALLIEILRVYFIMPFPGSQRNETIEMAYFIESHINLFRIIGLIMMAYPSIIMVRSNSRKAKIAVASFLGVWLVIVFLFNFQLSADTMFYLPKNKLFLSSDKSKVLTQQLVLGIAINGEQKAYPIELIGYHHQVRDSVGGEPVMVTYCTVCRTGRVYSPAVAGQPEDFRLVGMDHFNAMFEDSRTKSWWRQVSGEAIVGPLKGKFIPEIPAEQMRLDAWINLYPNTVIMQPDSLFLDEYASLINYDEGKTKEGLARADSLSWKDKSWVVGVSIGMYATAYDWHDLKKKRVINDVMADVPLLVVLESDRVSFHAFLRDSLSFKYDSAKDVMLDANTKSSWSLTGQCITGQLEGAKLKLTQSYQEYWHSWKTFHPNTAEFHPTN